LGSLTPTAETGL